MTIKRTEEETEQFKEQGKEMLSALVSQIQGFNKREAKLSELMVNYPYTRIEALENDVATFLKDFIFYFNNGAILPSIKELEKIYAAHPNIRTSFSQIGTLCGFLDTELEEYKVSNRQYENYDKFKTELMQLMGLSERLLEDLQ